VHGARIDRSHVAEEDGALAGEEVVDDDVGALDELAGDVLLRPQVEGQRLLVAIEPEEVRADVAEEGRAPAAGLIAAEGLLDLDDARPGVGQHLGAEGPGQDAGEVGDDDSVEGEGGFQRQR
jgi:hypothetical protein